MHDRSVRDGSSNLRLVTCCLYKCALDAYTHTEENIEARDVPRQKREGRRRRRSRFERKLNLGRALKLFCASVLKLCSTEVELFVSVESSYSVDFALQFGKEWDRIFAVVNFIIYLFFN